MKKFLFIALCSLLSACTYIDDGRTDYVNFSTIQTPIKPTITLKYTYISSSSNVIESFSEYYLKKYKETFIESQLFSYVTTDESERTDFTVIIQDHTGYKHTFSNTVAPIVTGLSWMIIPSFANTSDHNIDITIKSNKSNKEYHLKHQQGSTLGMGILLLPFMIFNDNIFTMNERLMENVILKTHKMIEQIER